ncbi:MAG: hypothetical protein IPK68_05420 [Bdellovibrionales bacterium]|nr:hypothetical protein [Bdellovibrionales bacterium]
MSRMPAKGVIAGISRKKYGPRPDERGPAREELFIKKDLNPYTAACGPGKDSNFVWRSSHMILKASGSFRCAPGFADEVIDLLLAGTRLMQKSIIREKGSRF